MHNNEIEYNLNQQNESIINEALSSVNNIFKYYAYKDARLLFNDTCANEIIKISTIISKVILFKNIDDEDSKIITLNIQKYYKSIDSTRNNKNTELLLSIYFCLLLTKYDEIDKIPNVNSIERHYNIDDLYKFDTNKLKSITKRLKKIESNEYKLFKYLVHTDNDSKINKQPKTKITRDLFYDAISTLSALFLYSGYIYNYTLLSPIISNYTSYLTISDYINTSINTIVYTSLSTLSGMFVAHKLMPVNEHGYRIFKNSSSRRVNYDKISKTLFIILLISVITLSIIIDEIIIFYISLIFLFIIVTSYAVYKHIDTFFIINKKIYILLMSFLALTFSLAMSGYVDSGMIISNKSKKEFLITTNNDEYTSNEYSIVNVFENYTILYKDKKAIAINNKNIRIIEIKSSPLTLYSISRSIYNSLARQNKNTKVDNSIKHLHYR